MNILRGIFAGLAFLIIVPFVVNAIAGGNGVAEGWHLLVLVPLSVGFGVWVARDGRLREPRSG